MEFSPRGGGNRLSECIKYATGVDLIEGAVKAAMGMTVDCISQKPYAGHWGEIVLHSDAEGKYSGLWISDEIEKNVAEKDIWVSEGDAVYGFDSANKAIGTLVLRFETNEELENVLQNQNNYFHVVVE